ncbi:chlorohydrolase [Streptococcus pneumoniae]|nr:chlorohydrolase [Streptococcus pneumoniae]
MVAHKHCFEVADETDEVSNTTLTRFEEIFKEY